MQSPAGALCRGRGERGTGFFPGLLSPHIHCSELNSPPPPPRNTAPNAKGMDQRLDSPYAPQVSRGRKWDEGKEAEVS